MKQQLTKLEMLWIRACKSKEPEKRLVSLYRRFYTRHCSKAEELRCILSMLICLCDEKFPITLSFLSIQYEQRQVIRDKNEKPLPFPELLFETTLNHIRYHINCNDLQQTTNFIPPKRFR